MRYSDKEQERLSLQALLDASKTQGERNRLGQFATPSELAGEMVECAKGLMPQGAKIRFLDPAFGTGAFYSSLLSAFSSSEIASATGFEIDPYYGMPTMSLWHGTGLTLNIGDFCQAQSSDDDNQKANLIVCNPPYVRHHHLDREQKSRLAGLCLRNSGIDLSGLGGLYCYFMGICHEWLAQSGVATWLIPSEFMDVNYGTPIKKYLLDKVTLIRVHRFDPHDEQFGDALVSSAVVVFRNEAPPMGQKVHFSFGGTLSNPKTEQYVPRMDVTPGQKWTKVFDNGFSWKPSDGIRLGDLFDIKRGIATGANSYFILNREQADEKGIPDSFLTPILPSPRYLDSNEIGALPDGTPDIDRKLYLVNCSLPEEIVERESKQLWRYIQEGITRGINNGYLCRNRWPWYAQEKREPALLLCSYMGRTTERSGPFRLILNHSNAIAPNVYLMLYPKRTLQRVIDKDPGLIVQVWEWLNDAIQAHAMQQSRVYGGGLHKVEPKELAALSIEGISTLLPWVREEPEVLLFK